MQGYDCDLMSIKETFIIVAINDYTNRVISGGDVNILMNGEKASLEKEEGYHVFLNLKPDRYNLSLGGWRFQQKDISVDLKPEREHELMKVRLLPNANYITGSDATVIRGTAEPGTNIRFLFSNRKAPYKLYNDYMSGEKRMGIYHSEDTYLDGKLFRIQKADGECEEFYIEEALKGEREYLINRELAISYKKSGTVIRRIYCVTADAKGEFFFLVPKEAEESKEYEYYLPDNRENIGKGKLEKGKVNEMERKFGEV